jgi:hypothetical protein
MFGIILLVVVIPASYTLYHFLHNDKSINIGDEDEDEDEITL